MSEVDPLKPPAAAARPSARYYPLPPAPPAAIKPISKWVWIGSVVLVLAACGASIPGYRYLNKEWHKADPLIAGLHEKMAKGDDAGIFAESDPAYQEQVGREKSDRVFDAVRQQLGAPQSSTLAAQFSTTSSRGGTEVMLSFSTIFDKGVATELLRLHRQDGVYRLLGYSVVSQELTVGTDQ